MNVDSLTAEWARNDARTRDDAAPVLALAERIAAVHFSTLVRLALNARSDAYTARERASRTYHVGFQDNRDADAYNAACYALAVNVRRLGYRATVRKPAPGYSRCALRVTLPDVETAAREAHPIYLRALETERQALLARSHRQPPDTCPSGQ